MFNYNDQIWYLIAWIYNLNHEFCAVLSSIQREIKYVFQFLMKWVIAWRRNFYIMWTRVSCSNICFLLELCTFCVSSFCYSYMCDSRCVVFSMYVVHITSIYLFYFGVLYFIYNNSETLRFFLDYVTELMKSLPLVGTLVEKVHL